MNVALTGKVNSHQKDMFKACVEGLTACEDILRPGNTAGDIFETHLKVLTKAGYGKHTLRGCGYTMGAMFPPTWMDLPMFYAGNPQVLEAGMVFFIHMILLNSDNGLAMSLGETAIVKDGNCELVTHAPRELVVN